MSNNKLVPFKQISEQVFSSRYPTTFLYNDGNVNLHSDPDRNVGIYNASGGTVNIISPGTNTSGGTVYNAFSGSVILCSRCGKQHQDQPYHCEQHGECFGNWTMHLATKFHKRCPVDGCSKKGLDFGSEKMFIQHSRKEHLWLGMS